MAKHEGSGKNRNGTNSSEWRFPNGIWAAKERVIAQYG
jgi:hypothetical protein